MINQAESGVLLNFWSENLNSLYLSLRLGQQLEGTNEGYMLHNVYLQSAYDYFGCQIFSVNEMYFLQNTNKNK